VIKKKAAYELSRFLFNGIFEKLLSHRNSAKIEVATM
jgi:hypothetical protein